jgi:hypothetical protein
MNTRTRAATACGGSSDGAGGRNITLVVEDFGNLGGLGMCYRANLLAQWTDAASCLYAQQDVGYFDRAARSVQRKPPQYLGVHNGAVRKIFEDRLGEVEVGTKNASTAWSEAITQAVRTTGG